VRDLVEAFRSVAPFIDALIVYLLIYRVLLLIKGTRAVPMLIGLFTLTLLYFVSQDTFLGLATFNWLLEKFIGSLFLIIVVVFQADIRRALVAFGGAQFFRNFRSASEAQLLDELVKCAVLMAGQRVGALVVLERDAKLDQYMDDSVKLDARVSKELVYALFVPERQNPLHDGAIVIRDGRVYAGGVFLPMSARAQVDRQLGTRHRAALGLSEETDAVVMVVSEERGEISLAVDGRLERGLTSQALRDRLVELLLRKPPRPVSQHQPPPSPAATRGGEPSDPTAGS